jgi:putative membrane protein
MSEAKPQSSDDLALQRTVMASERTFMAWTRTAISMISFGFAIPKILQYTEEAQHKFLQETMPKIIGVILIFLGVFVLLISAFQHGRLVRNMRRDHMHLKFSSSRLSFVVAVVLTLLGVLALVSIVFNIGSL